MKQNGIYLTNTLIQARNMSQLEMIPNNKFI